LRVLPFGIWLNGTVDVVVEGLVVGGDDVVGVVVGASVVELGAVELGPVELGTVEGAIEEVVLAAGNVVTGDVVTGDVVTGVVVTGAEVAGADETADGTTEDELVASWANAGPAGSATKIAARTANAPAMEYRPRRRSAAGFDRLAPSDDTSRAGNFGKRIEVCF
jgi:hypothetical protein